MQPMLVLALPGPRSRLPPSRNGIALDLPGSLPLGNLADAHYGVSTIQLDPADHLTFLPMECRKRATLPANC
jgi:hypothetical protein